MSAPTNIHISSSLVFPSSPLFTYLIQLILYLIEIQESPSTKKPRLERMTESELESELEEERKGKPQPSGLCLLQLLPTTSDDTIQFPLTKVIPCLCTAPGYPMIVALPLASCFFVLFWPVFVYMFFLY